MSLLLALCILCTPPLPMDTPEIQQDVATWAFHEQFYLPFVSMHRPIDPLLGVMVESGSEVKLSRYVPDNSIVKLALYWNEIELKRGTYTWKDFDRKYQAYADHDVIISIRNTPEWYRLYSPVCSPPKIGYYPEMLGFIENVIMRYEPEYIEFWNEPDVHPDNGAWYMGCWGSSYQSGLRYGYALTKVYERIKSIRPETKIFGGAFFLTYNVNEGNGSPFMEGAIAGSDNVPDAWSYHAYPKVQWDYFELYQKKAEYIRKHTDKPLWLTETSLLCYDDCGAGFEKLQADYLDYVFNTNILEGVIWFELSNTWGHCGLMEKNKIKPAYHRFLEHIN